MSNPAWQKEYFRMDFDTKLKLIEDIKKYLISPKDNKVMLYDLSVKYGISQYTVADNTRKFLRRVGRKTRIEYMYKTLTNEKE